MKLKDKNKSHTGFSTNRTNGESMAAVAVHVVDEDVVSAGNSNTVVLVYDNTVTDSRVITRSQVKPVAVVGGRQASRAVVGRVSGTVIERDVVDIETGAVADAEAVDGVVLDVDTVDNALAEKLGELNKVVGPSSMY